MNVETISRRLVFHGMILFLLGLLTGFVIPMVANPRMGVAAHLEGVMNGTFLVALAYGWTKTSLGPRVSAAGFWLALYGTYFNWFFVLLGAAWGAHALSPVSGEGFEGSKAQEAILTAGLLSISVAIIGATVIVLWGLRRRASGASPSEQPG